MATLKLTCNKISVGVSRHIAGREVCREASRGSKLLYFVIAEFGVKVEENLPSGYRKILVRRYKQILQVSIIQNVNRVKSDIKKR